MEKNQKKMKMNKGKIIAAIFTALAVVNLFIMFLYPEIPARLMGKDGEETLEISEEAGKGSEKAVLSVAEKERTFNGNGIFNPLEGIQALDTDGTVITNKVAIAYISGKTIQEKEIHYTVYDSENERLEASCKLFLENYSGPSITIKEPGKILWEDLENLTEVLVKHGVLKGNDGFGNDVSDGITYFYEIKSDMRTVEVTFSLMNMFQDYRNEKVIITVDNIPRNVF